MAFAFALIIALILDKRLQRSKTGMKESFIISVLKILYINNGLNEIVLVTKRKDGERLGNHERFLL